MQNPFTGRDLGGSASAAWRRPTWSGCGVSEILTKLASLHGDAALRANNDACVTLEQRRRHWNAVLPHSSLGDLTPAGYK